MSIHSFGLVVALSLPAVAAAAQAPPPPQGQEMPSPQALQLQAQHIAQERPREAEAAARAFLQLVAADRIAALDSLKSASVDAYWGEVGQLVVQFDMVQNLVRRDSVRAGLVAKMFGVEVYARGLQRAYRAVSAAQQQQIRAQLVTLIGRHFDIEDQLRALEVADIERRLTEVRAESARRQQKRTELVQWAVDGIIRDAMRPE
jgi:hypothetical protein